MKSKKIALGFATFALALGATELSFAGGQAGDPGSMSGSGCGTYYHTGGTCSVVWFKYTYTSAANSSHPQTWIPKANNGSVNWGSAAAIGAIGGSNDDSCRSKSSTFYAKGIAMADTKSANKFIYDGSQQFGTAPADYKSVDYWLSGGTSGHSYAYSSNYTLAVDTGADGDGAKITGAEYQPSGATIVAQGDIVLRSTARAAFCQAADPDGTGGCLSNSDFIFNTVDGGSFTFEGSSNQASWFCAYDKVKSDPENLESESTVSVSNSSWAASVTGYDDTTDGSNKASNDNLASGEYSFSRSSKVKFEGDASTKNKIKLSTDECKKLNTFGGIPTIDDGKITGHDADSDTGLEKCTYDDDGSFYLYPGQSKTISVSVEHPATVEKSGTSATGSGSESSSAEILISAKKQLCTNLGDGEYYIGVDDAVDYYRLGVTSSNLDGYNYTKVYPSTGGEDVARVWVAPEDNIRFKYDICSGSVLSDDANGVNNVNSKKYFDVTSDSNLADKSWIWKGVSTSTKYQAIEIKGDQFGANSTKRLENGYQASILSPWKANASDQGYKVTDNELGGSITNYLGDATGAVHVPYNYILEPSSSNINGANLSIGETFSFDAEVNRESRMNRDVRKSYATVPKQGTISHAWLFTMDDEKQASVFNGLTNVPGSTAKDYYYAGNSSENPMEKFAGDVAIRDEKDLNVGVETKSAAHLSYKVAEDEVVGTKVCALVAVWPADSHNDLSSNEVGGNIDLEREALTRDVSVSKTPLWRFNLTCRTVGKWPTMSVEGASAAVSKNVNTSTTEYSEHIFGSWMEYDLVAGAVKHYTGSGASLAYAVGPVSSRAVNDIGNSSVDGFDKSGEEVPQTLGNTVSTYGGIGDSNASTYVSMSNAFRDKLISAAADTRLPNIEFYCNNPGSTCDISSDINASGEKLYVILADNVYIRENVTNIDAIIIAKRELDTCYLPDGSNDAYEQKGGNEILLEKCGSQLVINGAVSVEGKIDLDRTFGGGSLEKGADNKYHLNPSSLSQRAEIFNYDPRILKFSYDYVKEYDTGQESYAKELAPRL